MPETKLSTLLHRSIFSGDGTISVRGDREALTELLLSDAPFGEEVLSQLLVLDIRAARSKPLAIGNPAGFSLLVQSNQTMSASLGVIRKETPDAEQLLAEYGIGAFPTGEVMVLAFRADAEVSVGADLRARREGLGLGGSFGVEAGGQAQFAYLRPFAIAGHTAGGTLKEFFAHLRLPSSIARRADVPEKGELLRLTFGGYLKGAANLDWGYSISRTSGRRVGELDLESRLYLEAQAKLGLSYAIAGNFEIDVTRAREDDPAWARVTVRKARHRSFELASDIHVKADLAHKGLPDQPSEFLEAALGLRAGDLLRQIDGYVDHFADADPAAVFDKLKQRADGLGKRFIDTLCDRVLQKPLDRISARTDVQKLHTWLVQVRTLHDELGPRVVGFLEDLEGGQLDKLIDTLKVATNDLTEAAGLQRLTDSAVWRLVDSLVDVEWIELIENTDGAFERLKQRVDTLQTAGLDQLRTFLEAKRDALGLAPLLNTLATLDPAKLTDAANAHLQDLLERLTGVGAEALKQMSVPKVRKLQAEVRKTRDQIDGFTGKLYGAFAEALNRSYELSVAYGYQSAHSGEALLDVEINLDAEAVNRDGLAVPSGADLFGLAVSGDFDRVLQWASDDRVVIRSALLTHRMTRARELSMNLFGWKEGRVARLVEHVSDLIEQKDGGVLHLYDIESTSTSKRKRRGEEIEQELALGVLAEGFDPIGEARRRAVDTVKAMSSSYVMRKTDTRTSEEELRDTLRFAERMGLIPSEYAGADGYLAEIALELLPEPAASGQAPKNFGATTVTYRLQYDAADLLQVFRSLERDRMEREARATLRRVAHYAYRAFDPFRGVSDAYVVPAMRTHWAENGLKTSAPGTMVYRIGESSRPITLSRHERIILDVLYQVEDAFVEEFVKLDRVMDETAAGQKPSPDELAKRLSAFVGFQRELNRWVGFNDRAVVPPLIAVLNRLIRVASRKPRTWTTTMELRIEAGDRSVRKLLMA